MAYHLALAPSDQERNDGGSSLCVLVLPDSDDAPPCRFEKLIGLEVSCLVPFDLPGPVPPIDVGTPFSVDGASMPEAAVNEDCHSLAAEHYVRTTVQPGKRSYVDAVSQTCTVEGSSDSNLGIRVRASNRLHATPDLWRRSEGPAGVGLADVRGWHDNSIARSLAPRS